MLDIDPSLRDRSALTEDPLPITRRLDGEQWQVGTRPRSSYLRIFVGLLFVIFTIVTVLSVVATAATALVPTAGVDWSAAAIPAGVAVGAGLGALTTYGIQRWALAPPDPPSTFEVGELGFGMRGQDLIRWGDVAGFRVEREQHPEFESVTLSASLKSGKQRTVWMEVAGPLLTAPLKVDRVLWMAHRLHTAWLPRVAGRAGEVDADLRRLRSGVGERSE